MNNSAIATTAVVQFQNRGVLSIPKNIRDFFNIAQGSLAKIFVKDNVIVVQPVRAVAEEKFQPRIFSKKEINRWIKEDTLDKKTLSLLDAKLKKEGVYDNPIVKKWLSYYDKK